MNHPIVPLYRGGRLLGYLEPPRNVRPIPPERLARIMGERVDLYEALREAPEECRGREGAWIITGIIGALSWLGVLWLVGAF